MVGGRHIYAVRVTLVRIGGEIDKIFNRFASTLSCVCFVLSMQVGVCTSVVRVRGYTGLCRMRFDVIITYFVLVEH